MARTWRGAAAAPGLSVPPHRRPTLQPRAGNLTGSRSKWPPRRARRDGTARHFQPVPVAASEASLTLFAHMSSGSPRRFLLEAEVDAGGSNEAGCSPRVSPANGTASNSPTPFTITFACTRPGVSSVLLKVLPEGSDSIPLRWSKHHGNALDVGTMWAGDDVVSVGVERPRYAAHAPTAVRNAYIKSDSFYLRLDPAQLNTTQEEAFNAEHGHAISASCSPSTVCGPSVGGNATRTYMLHKGPVLALTLDYNCKAADGVANVSVDIQMNPFASVSFSLLKYCQNMRGFFVSSHGASHDVVRFGDVQPSWVPPQNQSLPVHRYSATGDEPHGATLSFTLQATVQRVQFDKPVVDVESPDSPGHPVCAVTPSGSAAKGGTLGKNSEKTLNLDVDCGSNSGYVVVNVTIGLPPYRTVQWTLAKFHGTRPGFDVVAKMPLPKGPLLSLPSAPIPCPPLIQPPAPAPGRCGARDDAGAPSSVIRNGASVGGWKADKPKFKFGPASVHHTYMFQVQNVRAGPAAQRAGRRLHRAGAAEAGPSPTRVGQHDFVHRLTTGGQGGLRPRVIRACLPPRGGGRGHSPALRRPVLVQV